MSGLLRVSINQPTSSGGDGRTDAEDFAVLYASTKQGSDAAAPFKDIAQPAPVAVPDNATSPKLRLSTTAQDDGTTRLSGELTLKAKDETGADILVTRDVSVLVADGSAADVTDALVKVLARDPGGEGGAGETDPDAAAREQLVLESLAALIEALGALFPDVDLVLFPALPDWSGDTTGMGDYDFANPYDERFWQMAWAALNDDAAPADMDVMLGLSLRSSSVTPIAVEFSRDVLKAVQSGPRRSG